MSYPRKACYRFLILATLVHLSFSALSTLAATHEVGLYRIFETWIENNNPYENKFNEAELRCKYTSPSTRDVEFSGFFDGDGKGGGDAKTGNVWKLRFLPDELGEWKYSWSWSDETPGGSGSFTCVSAGAGKGILRAYKENPQWFAYNGTEPVWIKSYYETGHGSIAQPFDWITENVYQPMVDRGYNHLQVNWLLSLCCFGQYYLDGPEPTSQDLAIYEEGRASSTMRLDVWQMMERHLGWLNDRNVGVHMFLGFEGRKNEGPAWDKLSDEEQDFYVRYVVARVAPFANVAGWNFVWEDPGHRESHELGLARLLEKYDVFNHLRTYQDEHPRDNEYQRPEYTFAAIENHFIAAPEKPLDQLYRKTPWTHHQACLLAYVPGKPVYMSEGNALWRRYWHERTGATQDDLRQAAWGCATAGASFCWNGHAKEYELAVRGPEGLPFYGDDNPFTVSAEYIDILSKAMTEEVKFHRMTPQDHLLTHHDPFRVWCLAEASKQYVVFSCAGEPFWLHVAEGDYANNAWIDAKTGEQRPFQKLAVTKSEVSTDSTDERRVGTGAIKVTPPNRETDWVLILRSKE
ncbi:DUF5060 domain-containing protein [Bythopirellula polymerisocia]|uniref:DUF5060 domain-containing protein n=1 Tax=Bythopirellula polymerisocia TaxID=2528003 RepID=A0A5C6CTK3_9BACT|nr:DUF5060 domain-containing protein [Bythopirellula polymerisocia]TWU27728.1 hypothetical protein Pla144_25050 [Bythopirellula polymerisocia]